MDHSVLMAVVHALQNLLDAVGCVSLTVELSSDNVLKQFTTGHPEIRELQDVVFKNVGYQLTGQRRGSDNSPLGCYHAASQCLDAEVFDIFWPPFPTFGNLWLITF